MTREEFLKAIEDFSDGDFYFKKYSIEDFGQWLPEGVFYSDDKGLGPDQVRDVKRALIHLLLTTLIASVYGEYGASTIQHRGWQIVQAYKKTLTEADIKTAVSNIAKKYITQILNKIRELFGLLDDNIGFCIDPETAKFPTLKWCGEYVAAIFNIDPKSIIKYVVPNNVENLGHEVFAKRNVPNLTSVTFAPGSELDDIWGHAFKNCQIEEIRLPEPLRIISEGAFSGCGNLKTIYLPKTLKRIYKFTFKGCYNLRTIFYDGTVNDWNQKVVQEEYWIGFPPKGRIKVICADGTVIPE